MEEKVFYASDDKSSLELIEQEFALSQARSNMNRVWRDEVAYVNRRTIQAAVIVLVAVVFLLLLTSAFPDMR